MPEKYSELTSYLGEIDAGSAPGDAGHPLDGGATGADAGVDAGVVDAGAPVTTTFTSTSADWPNPERGFYGWGGSDFVSAYDANSIQAAFAAGQRLILCLVSLESYRTADLPGSYLDDLGNRFGSIRAAGLKCTLAFSYDFTAGGNDATSAQIKRHLEQLKPVLAANADVIPYMRAGFIGAWGEWHSSQSGNSCGYHSGTTPCETADANRLIVRDALVANVPATTQIGIRYPADLQKWYPSPTQQHRLGSHNDCFLAGPTDTGTYPSGASQRQYVQALTADAAFGGETCDNGESPNRTDCSDILAEGPRYHLAWLNLNYAPVFINSWKNGGCYDTVSAFMGYRLQLDAASHPAAVARGGSLPVDVDLRNRGWAKLFSARRLVVTLRHHGTGALLVGNGGDLGQLPAQATGSAHVTVHVPVPAGATTGTYEVLLSAPDVFASTAGDARFSVRFANADDPSRGQAFEAASAQFNVGTRVTVH